MQYNVAANDVLAALQHNLREQSIDLYIVPSADAHLSEYVSRRFQRRAVLTGFGGSAGTAVVRADGERNYLVVDGRYTIEAGQSVSKAFWQVRTVQQPTEELAELLRMLVGGLRAEKEKVVVAVDPMLVSVDWWTKMERAVREGGGTLLALEKNLTDEAWAEPLGEPLNDVNTETTLWEISQELGGDLIGKYERFEAWIHGLHIKDTPVRGRRCAVISSLDDIAWLTNVRANHDIPFSQLFYGYMIVTFDPEDSTSVQLFTTHDSSPVFAGIVAELASEDIIMSVHPYTGIHAALSQIDYPAVCDPQQTSAGVKTALGTNYHGMKLPIFGWAAVQPPAALAALRSAHAADARALAATMAKIYEITENSEYEDNADVMRELDVVNMLGDERIRCGAIGQSFGPIVAAGANSALPHYAPAPATRLTQPRDAKILPNSVLLIDSGGRFEDGSLTDTTRTFWIGPEAPPESLVLAYTAVLRGHIAASRVVLPPDSCTAAYDCASRQCLWQLGVDYSHSVGHGVGISVHEAGIHTAGLRTASQATRRGLEPGQVLTIEPGVYFEGEWGIRLENCYEAVAAPPPAPLLARLAERRSTPWAALKPLTPLPFEPQLVDKTVLNNEERVWLKNYHTWVLNEIGHLEGGAQAWVEERCKEFMFEEN